MKQLALDFIVTPSPTFANFVAGRNSELLQNLQHLTTGNTRERFIYIWGQAGSGRTHLLKSAVAAAQSAGAGAVYIAASGATRFAPDVALMDYVAVDDVDQLDEAAQVEIFNIYNELRDKNATLLVGGDAPPVQLKLREDVVTRLGWGLVYQVHALSDDEKTQALMLHAQDRGFRLSDEVCNYLLHHVRRDLPTLLAMLDALDRHSLETKRQVTVPLLRELLNMK